MNRKVFRVMKVKHLKTLLKSGTFIIILEMSRI
ncbi:hypothetical protein EDC14_1004131 [Hydrogenispora ethanolica]|uniref:Uncharacterized protein n=1 Tax=Hydrogenispora ethanolica TaxID=1082276 RepID=A0A4R1S4I6_HYDET|nr:hypothetical protein EDC14_1004131 [Hydrogenispora ethanolica]